MNVTLDDAFQFGLGVFETICLKNGQPILLPWHLERMNGSMQVLGIEQEIKEKDVLRWLERQKEKEEDIPELHAMKIMVSDQNKIFRFRANPYTTEKLLQGFRLNYSRICRNETSPFVYHKTMNYGDNILEKRRTKQFGIDEFIFLNTKGEICEGSTSNIFFVKEGKLYTPFISCGMLPGIMRRWVMEHFEVRETVIFPADVEQMEECFLTNSLMGIMPVTSLAGKEFYCSCVTMECVNAYRNYLKQYE